MRRMLLAILAAGLLFALPAAAPARDVSAPPKQPTAVGTGGGAATVDPLATQAAIDTLRHGGNAIDAAVAAAGVLGVVEPYSCGIGGGGFMAIYSARDGKVHTIDSRETAPAAMTPTGSATSFASRSPTSSTARERPERRRPRHAARVGHGAARVRHDARCATR